MQIRKRKNTDLYQFIRTEYSPEKKRSVERILFSCRELEGAKPEDWALLTDSEKIQFETFFNNLYAQQSKEEELNTINNAASLIRSISNSIENNEDSIVDGNEIFLAIKELEHHLKARGFKKTVVNTSKNAVVDDKTENLPLE